MTIRIRRRTSGALGAPSSLENAELAFNEMDNILYYGKGTGGAGGTATTIEAIGGAGFAVALTGNQSINGTKTFVSSPLAPTPTVGDSSTKVATTQFVANAVTSGSVADGDKGDVVVSAAGTVWSIDANAVSNAKLSQVGANTLKGNNTGSTANATDLSVAQVKVMLGLENVTNTSDSTKFTNTALTGVPTAPTATPGTNTTQIATTSFVSTAVSNLVASSPAALDTLNELAAALGNDANFATTVSTSLGNKADLTLSNLSNITTARTNLGLGTIATQAASNVNLTGGTIGASVIIEGGTF